MTINKSRILNYNKYILYILSVILIVCSLLSCGRSGEEADAYYDSLFSGLNRKYSLAHDSLYVTRADSIFIKTLHPSAYFQYKRYGLKAMYYYDKGVIDSAKIYTDSSAYALERGGLTEKYPMEYAHTLDNLADYSFMDNDLDKSFRYYSKTRNIRLSVNDDTCALSNATYHLGMVTYRQEKYMESAEFFKEAMREMVHCEDYFGKYNRIQEEMNNIALAYTRLKLFDSALVYYNKALVYIDAEGIKYLKLQMAENSMAKARGVVYGNMAKIYMELGQNDTAEQLLLKSIAINVRPGYENKDAMFSNIQLAELYKRTGRLEKVGQVLKDLRIALDTLANLSVDVRWHHLMYEYQKARNDPAEALVYLEKYDVLKDSSAALTQRLKKTDYGGLLKDQQSQYQITLLKKDAQLSKVYLWSTFGVVAVAIIIIALVYFSYRRSRVNITMLTRLNARVNEQKTQLEEAMVQLKENNDDKDRILRIVAHDLRTPINGIMIISDLVMQEEVDEQKRESLSMMITAAKNLLHLTNELLEFSGNAKLADKGVMEEAVLNEVVRQSVGLLMFKAQEKKQIITLNMVPYPVVADIYREKISRVLSNLISNALKFSKEGALIKVALSAENANAIIKVEDFGIGIPDSMIGNIFDAFTTSKRHGTSGERSYGLGLSICKQIVDAHNGKIWVESQEGQGSIFYVELPLKEGFMPVL